MSQQDKQVTPSHENISHTIEVMIQRCEELHSNTKKLKLSRDSGEWRVVMSPQLIHEELAHLQQRARNIRKSIDGAM